MGATVIPILLSSDQTHLTNFSGGKKLWPVYMTIGNIHSNIRNKPSYNVWILIALLPIPPKRVSKIPRYKESEQELDSLAILHQYLWTLLRPLADFFNSKKTSMGLEIHCTDEQIRCGFSILICWLADHQENMHLQGVFSNRCPICPCPVNHFGEFSQKIVLQPLP